METHSKETARNNIRTPRDMRLAFALLVLSTWLVFSASSFATESGKTNLGIAMPEDMLLINWVENFVNFLQGTGQLKKMQTQWLSGGTWIDDLP